MLKSFEVIEVLPDLQGDFITLTTEEVYDTSQGEFTKNRRLYGNVILGWFDIKENFRKLEDAIEKLASEAYARMVYRLRAHAEFKDLPVLKKEDREGVWKPDAVSDMNMVPDILIRNEIERRAQQLNLEKEAKKEVESTLKKGTLKVEEVENFVKKEERMLRTGTWVRVKNTGTNRYPIANRYVGRLGVVTDVRASGNSTIVELEIHDRVSPLVATAGSLEILD